LLFHGPLLCIGFATVETARLDDRGRMLGLDD